MVGLKNCNLFETSMTANIAGIQCDHGYVYGRPHPFGKLLGPVLTLNDVFYFMFIP
jgi:hypothetical protein